MCPRRAVGAQCASGGSVTIAAILVAGCQGVPGTGAKPTVLSWPDLNGPIDLKAASWLRLPSGPELAAAYPRAERERYQGGSVQLKCHFMKTAASQIALSFPKRLPDTNSVSPACRWRPSFA